MTDNYIPIEDRTDRGWGRSDDTAKFHYFPSEDPSLCGKASAEGIDVFNRHTGNFDESGPNDCGLCSRALVARGGVQ